MFLLLPLGILVIERPCGVVVDVKELFGSESKSQVYAHLHNLLDRPALENTSVWFKVHLDRVKWT